MKLSATTTPAIFSRPKWIMQPLLGKRDGRNTPLRFDHYHCWCWFVPTLSSNSWPINHAVFLLLVDIAMGVLGRKLTLNLKLRFIVKLAGTVELKGHSC